MKSHYDFSKGEKPNYAKRFPGGAVMINGFRGRATTLDFTNDYLIVYLDDARVIQVPLIWFPRLYNATPEQLHHYQWIGRGTGIEWPDLDEHLSVHGFLTGQH